MVNENQTNDYIEIDLLELLAAFKARILVIILCGIIGCGIAGGYSYFLATPIYESTAKMYVLSQSTSITSLADIQMSASLAQDYKEMITCRPVINQVRKNLALAESYSEVVGMVSIDNPSNTRILNISVENASPEMAAAIANEIANVSKESISEVMDTDAPRVFQKAIVSSSPIKPSKTKNMAIGLILGVMLACVVITIMVVTNDRLKTTEDIEKLLGLNVLANVPDEYAEMVSVKDGANAGYKFYKR